MNINVEIGNGITIKVPAEKYYNSTDLEWSRFIEENIMYPQHQWFISDPFDDSAITAFKSDILEDQEDIDLGIDFNPKDWD